MPTDRNRLRSRLILGSVILAAVGVGGSFSIAFARAPSDGLEFEKKSKFSHIKVVKKDNQRILYFVSDKGVDIVESIQDVNKPHDMVCEYTRFMFMSYLFRPKQDKVLLVGLGGGSMVHFLKHYDPKVKVDVVEIDPGIVDVADKFFGVRKGGNVNIIIKDGFEFFKTAETKYDVVYMDAFLKPSAETDDTGVSLRLRTKAFYKEVQQKLNPDGLVVFNINWHEKIADDVKTIRESFPQVYPFELKYESLVVVASMAPARVAGSTLITRAQELDRRFQTSFSFRDMVRKLAK